MSTFDDIRNNAQSALNDLPPEKRQKIEQIAEEKGIPIEQAREHFFNLQQDNDNQNQHPEQSGQLEEDDRNL